MSLDLKKIYEYQRKFAEDRDWEQFHTPKNLSMALAIEASSSEISARNVFPPMASNWPISPNFEESIQNNEKYHTILKTNIGNMEITRIAGLVAPRVHTFISNGENVKRGDVMGLIVFSSMVLLTLPSYIKLNINKGDTVTAGKTIIGYID